MNPLGIFSKLPLESLSAFPHSTFGERLGKLGKLGGAN